MTYFTELAERVGGALWSGGAASSNSELLAELDNFRAALMHARVHDKPALVRIAGALSAFWTENGLHEEGRRWLKRALAIGGAPAARFNVLLGLTWIAALEGDYEAKRRYADEMLTLATQNEDSEGVFRALQHLGLASEDPEDLSESEAFFERAAAIADTKEQGWHFAEVTGNLGSRHLLARSYERALSCSERAAELWRRLHHPVYEVINLTNAGYAALELGELDLAALRLREAVTLADRLGVRIVHQLGGIAALQLARGNAVAAARLVGAAQKLSEQGFIFEPFELFVYGRTRTELASVLEKPVLDAALAEGAAWGRAEAVRYALGSAEADAFLSRF